MTHQERVNKTIATIERLKRSITASKVRQAEVRKDQAYAEYLLSLACRLHSIEPLHNANNVK